MQIQTIWQPAYTPPGFSHVEAIEKRMLHTKDRVEKLLTAKGILSRTDIMKQLSITSAQLRHSMALLRDVVAFEQSGNGAQRICMYWIASSPPPTEKRCGMHRVYEWYRANPWRPARDIPDDIYSEGGHKHGCVCTLEKNGRLLSRKQGGRKIYKAVI